MFYVSTWNGQEPEPERERVKLHNIHKKFTNGTHSQNGGIVVAANGLRRVIDIHCTVYTTVECSECSECLCQNHISVCLFVCGFLSLFLFCFFLHESSVSDETNAGCKPAHLICSL